MISTTYCSQGGSQDAVVWKLGETATDRQEVVCVSSAGGRGFDLAPQPMWRLLDSLARLEGASALLGDDFPSGRIRKEARAYLERLNSSVVFAPSSSRVDPFQGELHFHWFGSKAAVTLMFTPDTPGAPKLYKESHEGHIATASELKDEPTEAEVREAIEWAAR